MPRKAFINIILFSKLYVYLSYVSSMFLSCVNLFWNKKIIHFTKKRNK